MVSTSSSSSPGLMSKIFNSFGFLFALLGVLLTIIAVAAAGIYFSGYSDEVGQWIAKKYYAYKAKAQIAALGKVGSEKAEGYLKESLKNNPVMGEHELDQVSSGLGKEAAQQGLGGVSKKLGGLGKI